MAITTGDISQIIGILGDVGVQAFDRKQRRDMEARFASLGAEQQKQLANKLLNAKSDSEKLNILSSTYLYLQNQPKINQIQKQKNLVLAFIGLGVIALTFVIYKAIKK
jgi:hypothetical protein